MPNVREPFWRRYARFVRPNVAADIQEELDHHLGMRAAEFERRGMNADDARRAAFARFGNVSEVTDWLRTHDHARQRTKSRRESFAMIAQQFRLAARSLLRQPAFSIATVLTLAFGIGATTAIFAVVNRVLLAPLPYAQPDRLVSVRLTSPLFPVAGQSHASFETLRRLNKTASDMGLHQTTSVNVTDGVTPVRLQADSASLGIFSALRIVPRLGRLFSPDDVRPGHAPVTLISEGMWRERFDADEAVIGRTIQIDGRSHQIVGVLPRSIQFPQEGIALWLPLELSDADLAPVGLRYESIARLRDGVTREMAERDFDAAILRSVDFFPVAAPGIPMRQWLDLVKPRITVHPLRDDIVGDVHTVLWVILATIVFVLLAACTNIATLFLVRAEGRTRELAVRSALGAGRFDAIVRFVAEGTIVATLGAALGIAGAHVALGVLRRSTDVPLPRIGEVGIDATVGLAGLIVTFVVAMFTSALPILRFGLRDLSTELRSGGRNATSGRERRRLQGGLVATQVALAFVLLSAAALMTRTFVSLRQVQPGFSVDKVLAFRLALPNATYRSDTAITQFYDRLQRQLLTIPGVDAVGLSTWLPLDKEGTDLATVFREDAPPSERAAPTFPQSYVSPSYFRAIGIPLIAGKTFRDLPAGTRSDEAVVSVGYAEQSWGPGGANRAIGRRIRFLPDADWITIVGVVGDVHQEGLDRAASTVIYLSQNSKAYGAISTVASAVAVVMRTRGAPEDAVAASRREVASLDAALPMYNMRLVREVVSRSMARTSMTALMLLVSAIVAVSLGAIGLYGIVSYTVEMRTREIGVRLALGEPPRRVIGRFACEGAVLAMFGVAIGLAGAMFLTRVLRGLLYGVGPNDPVMYATAAVVLVVTALLASWIPARRASRMDPAAVLAGE